MDIRQCKPSRYVFNNLFLAEISKLICTKNMYQVPQGRPHDPVGQDAGHSYPRHDGGEGDADAEGERDYDVG